MFDLMRRLERPRAAGLAALFDSDFLSSERRLHACVIVPLGTIFRSVRARCLPSTVWVSHQWRRPPFVRSLSLPWEPLV